MSRNLNRTANSVQEVSMECPQRRVRSPGGYLGECVLCMLPEQDHAGKKNKSNCAGFCLLK